MAKGKKRPIQDSLGNIFASVANAARHHGLKPVQIHLQLSGKSPYPIGDTGLVFSDPTPPQASEESTETV